MISQITKSFFTIALILYGINNLTAQWLQGQRSYGGGGYDMADAVEQTNDGGYIMIGYTNSFGAGSFDVYLVKTDAYGKMLWTRTYGGVNDDRAWAGHQTNDGGYIVVGITDSFGAWSKVYLIKTDANGDTLWTKTYGDTDWSYAMSVEQTNDGGYILAGGTYDFGAGNEDFYLIKTDSIGDTLWTRTYGGALDDGGYLTVSVKQTNNGGYILTGYTNSFGAGGLDVCLINIDPNGDTLWTRTYGGTGDEAGTSVEVTNDGGYIVAGFTNSYGAGMNDVYIIKTDSLGDTVWTRTYGESGNDWANGGSKIEKTVDGGYIVVTTSNSFGAGGVDVYLIKINSMGDTLWTKTYGGVNDDWGRGVGQTSDGGYIVAGGTASFGAGGGFDVYLIKTDSLGNSGCIQMNTSTIISGGAVVGFTAMQTSSGGISNSTPTFVSSPTIADSNLCLDSIVVDLIASDTTLCINDCINFSDSTKYPDTTCCSPWSWLWSFPGAIPTSSTDQHPANICYDTTGAFDVTLAITNANGTYDTIFTNYITVNPAPATSTTSTDVLCIGDSSGSATVTPAGGALPYTYLWDPNASSQTDSTATGLPAGSFTVTVTDANGCADTAAVTINNPVGTSIAVDSIKNVTCNGDGDGAIYITFTGGTTPYTYLWTSTDTIEDVINLSGGSYGVTITDNAGCQSILDTSISEPTAISISIATVNVACNGDSTGSATATPSGGITPYIYTWNDPASQTDSTATGLTAGAYSITVTDANGCAQSDSVTISEPSSPLGSSITSTDESCSGNNDGSATVAVSGGITPYAYTWSNGDNTATADTLTAGTYTVTVTDSNGCQIQDSVTISTSPSVVATAGPDTVVCIGESVQLNSGGGTGYNWSPTTGLNNPAIQNPVASPSATTTYMVVVTSGSCVPDTAYVTVTINPLPSVFAGYDTTIMLGNIVQLSGSGGIAYNWTPSIWLSCTACQSPIAIPEETITYIMTATDANSCSNTDSITIEVDNEFIIFVPDIFSPNANDFDNRAFTIRGKGIRKVISLVIYDRWGEKVFENKDFNANDPSQSWDGSYRGQLMNPGVFVYILEVVFENDEEKILKGDVTLVH